MAPRESEHQLDYASEIGARKMPRSLIDRATLAAIACVMAIILLASPRHSRSGADDWSLVPTHALLALAAAACAMYAGIGGAIDGARYWRRRMRVEAWICIGCTIAALLVLPLMVRSLLR
jgi:hypothetical protein